MSRFKLWLLWMDRRNLFYSLERPYPNKMAIAQARSIAVNANYSMYLIRQYKDSDLEGLLSSWEEASKLAHPFLSEEFLVRERKNIPEIYLPNADTWVAEIEGEPIGFIALLGNEVGAIFLQPKHHHKGIGKALMDKARELHGDLEVEVFSANRIGREFYSKYGFELLEEKVHEPTGQEILRLKYTAGKVLDKDR